MLDTPQGLLCCATEPIGISNEADTNPEIYTGQTFIFIYNGDDFIPVKTWDHNDPSTWVKLTNIIQCEEKPLFIDHVRKKIFEYTASTNIVSDVTSRYSSLSANSVNFLDLLESYAYGQKYNPNYPNPIPDILSYDNIIYVQNIQSDDASIHCYTYAVKLNDTPSMTRINDSIIARNSDASYANIDTTIDKRYSTTSVVRYPIVRPSDSSRNYNYDFIQNILSKNIPLDKALKVIGSIVCNGVRFNVSALKIETHAGENNREFKSLVFNIDKHFRSNIAKDIFTEEPGVIRFGYGDVERNIQKINMIILYQSIEKKEYVEESDSNSEVIIQPSLENN